MKYPRFVIFTNTDNQCYCRFFNDRGKKILTGHPCQNRHQCVDAIHQLYTIINNNDHYRISKTRSLNYFELIDHHSNVIATSITYRTLSGMAFGIHSLKNNVARAVIEDYHPRVTLACD